MGQINTNNYPTVSSLADADLLIVENAINGTGTTTPKQLRENAIGTDTLETTAQTVTGAINELKDEIDSGTSFTLAGAGSEKNYSSGVVDTDIYLHRAPKIGDRLLIRFVSTYTSPPSIKVYDEEGGTAYTLSFGQWSSVYKLSGICLLEVVDFLGDLALDFIYNFNGKEYQSGNGIAISGTTIRNTAMQKGDNAAYVEVDEPITSGNLGFGNGDARYLFVNFEVDVTPNDTTHLYYMFLTSGLAMGLAVLKDRDGNDFSKNLYAGMMLFCKRESGGSGTEGDPYILTVVSVFDWSVGDDGAIKAGGRVQDGEGNDLASVAALEVSASGNPIIVNAQPVDAKELSVELEPIQDLHGYDHPWAGGAGKNKIGLTVTAASTIANVSCEAKADNEVIMSGTTNGQCDYNIRLLNNVTFTNGTTVTFSFTGTYSVNPGVITVYLAKATSGYVSLGNLDSTGKVSYTFTADEEVKGIMFRAWDASMVLNVDAKAQLEIGSSKTDFAPYSNICPISGRTETSVQTNGKNKVKLLGLGFLDLTTGDIPTGVTSSDYAYTNRFRCSNQAYVVSGSIIYQYLAYYWDVDGNFISYDGGSIAIPFTPPSNAYYAALAVRVSNAVSSISDFGTVQCEVGSTATAYEPYKSSSATISFGTTVYGGQVDFKTGRVMVDRVKGTLPNTVASWGRSSDWAVGSYYTQAPFADIKPCTGFSTLANITSNMAKVATPASIANGTSGTGTIGVGGDDGKNIYVNFGAEYDTAEKLATFLTNNPCEVCYELATPTELTLTPQALELLKGYNYITGDGEMSMVYIPESVLPTPPTTDGTYKLICTVANGIPTFSWAAN